MRKGDLVRVRMSPASHHRGPMALRPTTPDERAQWYDGFYKRVAEGNISLHPFGELPANARAYVERLEELSGTRVSAIGVGPGREQTIVRHDFV